MANDMVDTTAGNVSLQTLVDALNSAVEAMYAIGHPIVCTPSEDEFAKVRDEMLSTLLTSASKEELQAIMKFHVDAGRVHAAGAP